jgi:hypothetical protein
MFFRPKDQGNVSQTLPDLIFPKCHEDFKQLQNSNDDETLVVYTVYDADQRPLFRFKKKKSGGGGKFFSSTRPPGMGGLILIFC